MTKLVKLDISKTIGEKLRELREAKRLSLSYVADQLKVDISFLSKVEHSNKQPTRQQIIQLSQILEANEKYLLIEYLSDKLVYEVRNEDLAVDAIKVAKQKIEYLKKTNRLI